MHDCNCARLLSIRIRLPSVVRVGPSARKRGRSPDSGRVYPVRARVTNSVTNVANKDSIGVRLQSDTQAEWVCQAEAGHPCSCSRLDPLHARALDGDAGAAERAGCLRLARVAPGERHPVAGTQARELRGVEDADPT